MSKTVTCDLCPKDNPWEGDARGLPGHKRFKHGSSQRLSEKSPETASAKLKEQEEKPMTGEKHGTEFCPNCHQPYDAVQDFKLSEMKHAAEAKEHQDQAAALKTELEEAKKQALQDLPSVTQFVEHCKGCEIHKPQLRQFMDQVMGAMSEDEVKAQMKRLSIEPAPEKIVITGLDDRKLK